MPDPTDPRLTALQNIQDTSRAYGRSRRRGQPDANVDPAFRAALEVTDPEARRTQLAQYARGRAQQVVGAPPMGGGDPSLPSQASVMSQVAQPMAGAPKPRRAVPMAPSDVERMAADVQTYGSPGDVDVFAQNPSVNAGKDLLAPRYQERIDEANDHDDDLAMESSESPATQVSEGEVPAGDGIDQIGRAAQAILARRRAR